MEDPKITILGGSGDSVERLTKTNVPEVPGITDPLLRTRLESTSYQIIQEKAIKDTQRVTGRVGLSD